MELEELKKKYKKVNITKNINDVIDLEQSWHINELISELEYIRDKYEKPDSHLLSISLDKDDDDWLKLSFHTSRLETDQEYLDRLKKEQERLAKLIETEKSEFEKAKKTYLKLKEKYEN